MSVAKLYKLVFNVPLSHADRVRRAIGDAGAGQVGNYSHCSFSVRGTGRFLPNSNANPHIGKAGIFEEVEEEQIQVDVKQDRVQTVIDALLEAHPYEEVGFEVYEQLDWREIVKA
jgi:hypothetical protein